MYKILALLVLVFVALVRSDSQHFNDCLNPGDNATLLYYKEVSKSGQLLVYQEEIIRIPEEDYSPGLISCITILNLESNEVGGYPSVLEGGVGFNYVVLQFKSQWGLGFDFRVSVYYDDTTE